MKTHFFFALVLPDEVKAYLHGVTEQIKPDYPFKKWLHQADYHITMAFLGDAPEPMRKDAIQRVKQALAGESSFNLELSETGVFGQKDSPRILWADVKREERLYAIQSKIYNACTEAGFMLDKKPFKPHITLARKFTGENFSLDGLRHSASLGPQGFKATRIALYQTHIGASPSYVPIDTIILE